MIYRKIRNQALKGLSKQVVILITHDTSRTNTFATNFLRKFIINMTSKYYILNDTLQHKNDVNIRINLLKFNSYEQCCSKPMLLVMSFISHVFQISNIFHRCILKNLSNSTSIYWKLLLLSAFGRNFSCHFDFPH